MKNKSPLITIFVVAGTISLFIFLTCIYSGLSGIQNDLTDVKANNISLKKDNDTLKKEFKVVTKEIKLINTSLRFHQSEDSVMFEKVGAISKTNALAIDNNAVSISKLTKSKNQK